MAVYSDIITVAYFISGQKSPDQNATLTTNEITIALNGISYIIAHFNRMPWFNIQLQELSTDAKTTYIYIGETVTSSDSDVTVIVSPYYTLIYAASIQIGSAQYVMRTMSLNDLRNTRTSFIAGKSTVLYYDNFLDDNNNYYTKIQVNPTNNTGIIHMIGSAGLTAPTDETDTILYGFELYFAYELSRYISAIYGRMGDWESQNSQHYIELKDEFESYSQAFAKPKGSNTLTQRSNTFILPFTSS